MIRTITIGSHVQIQGLFIRALAGGNVIVSVGGREFEGKPVSRIN